MLRGGQLIDNSAALAMGLLYRAVRAATFLLPYNIIDP